jgi:peptidyl-prolyl cis-trans isomerase SurA
LYGLPAVPPGDQGRLTGAFTHWKIPDKGVGLQKCFVAALAILVAGSLASGCKKQEAPAPDVWAVVNGNPIHREEVEKYYRSRTNPESQEPSQEEGLSLKLSILDELVNNEILLERAQKLGLQATDGEVEDKFTEVKAPYTEEEFQRQMKSRGLTVDDLKSELRRQLSIQKLVNREVVAKIAITDQDITDFYNQNRAQFNVAEQQYHIAKIVVTPRKDPQIRNRKNDDATNDADAHKKCAMLLDRLNAGVDFAELAMDYSEDPTTASTGGDLGFIPESALNSSDPALKRAVLTLRPGQVSKVIALKDSYVVLKLIGGAAPGQRQLADPQVQQMIRDTLHNRKEQLLRSAYMAVARDDARVTNYLARQILESSGKLPEGARPASKQASPPSEEKK